MYVSYISDMIIDKYYTSMSMCLEASIETYAI